MSHTSPGMGSVPLIFVWGYPAAGDSSKDGNPISNIAVWKYLIFALLSCRDGYLVGADAVLELSPSRVLSDWWTCGLTIYPGPCS
jgi:hypothetical protein